MNSSFDDGSAISAIASSSAARNGGVGLALLQRRFLHEQPGQLGQGGPVVQPAERQRRFRPQLRLGRQRERQHVLGGRGVADLADGADRLEAHARVAVLLHHQDQHRHRGAAAQDADRAGRLDADAVARVLQAGLQRRHDRRVDGEVGLDDDVGPLVRIGVEEVDDPRQRRADAALARQVEPGDAGDRRLADVLLGVAGQRDQAGQRADVVERLQRRDDGAADRRIGIAGDGDDVGDGALHLVLADEDDGLAAPDRVRIAEVVDQAVDRHLSRLLRDGRGGREQGDGEDRRKSEAHESQPTTADQAGKQCHTRIVARHDLNRTAIPGKLAGERSSATPKPPDDARSESKDGKDAKKKIRWSEAWQEASVLVWARRGRLALGLALMLVNRLSGLVLPASSKYLIDDVLTKGRTELLMPIALVTGAATFVQAITSYALSQVLGIAAQAAITEMRRAVHEHITHLPVRYFDKTQSGVLISRVMSDAEGIRNLVGTGLVQLTGSIVTAVLSLGVLFYLNWHLTLITLIILGAFGGVMGYAFKKLRPLFRERGKINAEVTGRLTQALGGIRVVKAYTAEKREQIVFAQGVHKLLRNVTAVDDRRVDDDGAVDGHRRHHRRRDDPDRRQRHPGTGR